jgi:hypothetical protein
MSILLVKSVEDVTESEWHCVNPLLFQCFVMNSVKISYTKLSKPASLTGLRGRRYRGKMRRNLEVSLRFDEVRINFK